MALVTFLQEFSTQPRFTYRHRWEAGDVIVKGYVVDVAEVYDNCRVFVAPLLSGAGIKGKVIGALASGVPCVLSAVAAEGMDIRGGTEALIASDPGTWTDSIVRLYGDKAAWEATARRMGFAMASRLGFGDHNELLPQESSEKLL